MNLTEALSKRNCPVCDSTDENNVMFPGNINEALLGKLAFASRKIPEFMNLKLVCCPNCDLLYAPSVPSADFLCTAYQDTGYDSNEEANYAANSYASWLPKILPLLPERMAALEVGAGNGAFLAHLKQAGFKKIVGVEPSLAAVNAATHEIKKFLQIGMFNAQNYSTESFDLITAFQTLEHIDSPAQFFQDAFHLLKQGGIVMVVAHNYRHWLMRLLGKRSPIIDIEHLQLFSPKSLRFTLENMSYRNIQVHALQNTYPLHYWVKLLPIPRRLKILLLKLLKSKIGSAIGSIGLRANVGNLVAWAQK